MDGLPRELRSKLHLSTQDSLASAQRSTVCANGAQSLTIRGVSA